MLTQCIVRRRFEKVPSHSGWWPTAWTVSGSEPRSQ